MILEKYSGCAVKAKQKVTVVPRDVSKNYHMSPCFFCETTEQHGLVI